MVQSNSMSLSHDVGADSRGSENWGVEMGGVPSGRNGVGVRSSLGEYAGAYDYSYIDYRSLDLISFRELMLELKPQWSRDLSGLDRLFVAFDADHNGAIDVHEFMQGIQALSQVGSRNDKLRMLFLAYDSGGMGRLNKHDVASLLRTTNAMLDRSAAKVLAEGRCSDELMVYNAAADAILQTVCSSSFSKGSENGEQCDNAVLGDSQSQGDMLADFDEFSSKPDIQPIC